jgi:hypothetical protein
MLTEQILLDAIAWGRAYGDAIPASQWDEMRDAKVKQLVAQGVTLTDDRQCAIDTAINLIQTLAPNYAETVRNLRSILDDSAPRSAIPSIRTFINVGTGYVLDGIGALSAFDVKRDASETDDSYRKRLLTKLDELELPL